ncbi:CU044_5270 family protein [Streptomyces sp. NPDC038707]|uniref:CU044_5270 family protein n=1 Tax=Streptomyces sp. NPDC038707 TaxID=3154329 RepID=UPI00340A8D70
MRELDQSLRAMNPVAVGRPADETRLEDILALPRDTVAAPRSSSRPALRWWLAAAATATAAAVAFTVTGPFGTASQPALALTPVPLAYQPSGRPAAEVLRDMADRVADLPDDRPAPWKTEHFVWDSWSLSTRVDDIQVTSAVIPEHRETWQKSDGSAHWKTRTLPPEFQNRHQRELWEDAGALGRTPQQSTGSGDASPSTEPPTTVQGMRAWLANGQRMGPGLLYEVVPERFQDHVFSPAQRAALLRVLADTKGIVHTGKVKDRAGRTGEAFSLTGRFGGLPDRRTLILDPRTGNLLASEEQILDDTGKLNVKPYSVIGYITFVKSDRLA